MESASGGTRSLQNLFLFLPFLFRLVGNTALVRGLLLALTIDIWNLHEFALPEMKVEPFVCLV